MARGDIDLKNYCNNIFSELDGVKTRLNGFIRQIEGAKGKEAEHIHSHADHLREIIKTIDWKLEIFTKVCPLESGGYDKGATGSGSVPTEEGKDFSGGYVGG